MNKLKRGFTIVELMMVIGIMAVLMTLITTAATGAIREARAHKANAIVALVQAGFNTYYAQTDKWPGFDADSVNPNSGDDNYRLSDAEVDTAIAEMVRVSAKNHNPILDITGLFVCRKGTINEKTVGMDFMDAIHGSKKHPKEQKMKLSEMCFGYPDKETGRFRRLKIVYSIPSDSITVSK